jgi:hypothetical protein
VRSSDRKIRGRKAARDGSVEPGLPGAGEEIGVSTVSERIRQHRLASGLHERPSLSRAIRADAMWLHLRGLADILRARTDGEAADAIAVFEPTGDEFKDNVAAAFAETLASTRGFEPPPWTKMIRPLSTPWFPAGMARVRAQVEVEALPAFRRRGLMLRACEFSHPAIADPFQSVTRLRSTR